MFKCKCGKEYTDKDFTIWSDWFRCECGGEVRKPHTGLVNFNYWKPDYRQMDGEKEFTAAGGYE